MKDKISFNGCKHKRMFLKKTESDIKSKRINIDGYIFFSVNQGMKIKKKKKRSIQ
jgi:hypothetical protein